MIHRWKIKLSRWWRFVRTPNTYPKRWQDRVFRGHVNIGPVTIYGANAMHWAVNVRIGDSWWCFHPRTHTFGTVWPWYFYISTDGTPHGATLKTGSRFAGGAYD